MNEKIRELAEQAEIKFEAHLQHAWIDTAVITPADLKKFAELIVRECADISDNIGEHGYIASQEMKQLFGIE
jgi:hypothetical protein